MFLRGNKQGGIMKKALVLVAVLAMFLTVSCTKPAPEASPICPYAGIGVKMVTDLVVLKVGTCSSQKITNKILPLLNCPATKAMEKAADLSTLKLIVCPVVVNLLSTVAGQAAGSADLDCEPAVITALLKDANVCELIFKK